MQPKQHTYPAWFGYRCVLLNPDSHPHDPLIAPRWGFTYDRAQTNARKAWRELNRQDRRDEQGDAS